MNTALFDLVEQHRIDPAQVKKLRIGLSPTGFDLHGGLARYKGKFDALISAHHTAAVVLPDQEPPLAQFRPAPHDDRKLRRAAGEQVEIRPDPALNGVQATVEIEATDGSKLSRRCEHPRGSAENPLSRAQIEKKFRTYAPARLGPAAVDTVIAAVDRLEDLSS